MDINEKDLYNVYVDRLTKKGLLVKFNEYIKCMINNDHLETMEDEEKSQYYQKNRSLVAMVRKNDINKDKIFGSLKLSDTYEGPNRKKLKKSMKNTPFIDYFNEEFLWTRKFFSNNAQKWTNVRIGNFIQGKITLIKDYGIILNIGEDKTGFLTNNNLLNEKTNYKIDSTIQCRILDIDYEKGILDLVEVKDSNNPVISKKSDNSSKLLQTEFNLSVLRNSGLLEKKSKNLSGKILLLKENYLIVSLDSFDEVIALIESKCLNDCFETTERYQHGMKLKNIKIVNVKQLKLTFSKIFEEQTKDELHLLNKVNYIPLGIIEKNKGDNDKQAMDIETTDQKPTKAGKKLGVGQFVEGKITSIKKNNIYVLLDQKM